MKSVDYWLIWEGDNNRLMDVKHFLGIYMTRKEMQDSGLTNPTDEVKTFTNIIVEKLSLLPLDEPIDYSNNSLIDSKGNVIVTFPSEIK